MKSDEKPLIDGLFSRLREAEGQSAPRDAEAEAQINQHLVRQPAAPYYMAQVVLIQEAALKRLDQRVKELEAQVAQLQQSRPSSGGFLSGLFGVGGGFLLTPLMMMIGIPPAVAAASQVAGFPRDPNGSARQ